MPVVYSPVDKILKLYRTYGGKLVSLDHLEKYLALTKQAVKRHQLEEQIECRFAPLEKTECDGRTFDWYSADALGDQHDITYLSRHLLQEIS